MQVQVQVLAGAVTADPLGVLVAFGAGILSFLSPCVLPLVPGYLSMVSGLSAAELASGRRHVVVDEPGPALAGVAAGGGGAPSAVATLPPRAEAVPASPAGPAGTERRRLGPLMRGMLLFVAGFTVVFVGLGALATGVHHLLEAHKQALTSASGALIVVLGAVMLVSALPATVWARLGPGIAGRAGWLLGERRVHLRPDTLGAFAAPVMGMAFAFAWTPCIGPVLGAVLALASTRSTLGGAMLLLVAYSLGLGVPFIATGLAFDRLTTWFGRARRHLALVQVIAGAVLLAFGLLLVAGGLGWLSAQFSNLLNHLGLHRLTSS